MEIRRTGTLLCLIFALSLLPGCWGRNQKKAIDRTNEPARFETSIDLPPAYQEEKLSKIGIGISSEPGELIANQQEEAAPTPSAPADQDLANQESAATATSPASIQEEDAGIEFHFENTDLDVLISQISELYDVTFVADDSITPMLQGAKSVKGTKISFKTQRPLTKKEAWDLFLTFLEIAGFAVISEANPTIKRIVTLENALKSPLPAFIGVPHSTLPNSDEMIRYVYFVENADLKMIEEILRQLKSPVSNAVLMRELKAFMITDKSYNIKSLMNIIAELDKVTMPQAMSVLKLRRADAEEVVNLYKSLAGTTEKDLAQQRFFPGRKPSASFFPENLGIYAEKRTNSLILLGQADAIKRIEDFIIQSVDVDLSQPYSPLHVLPLRYADATTIANIMNEVTKFGATTEAGKSGGVRGGDKYLKPISFFPEIETNRLVVKGDYEDFLKAKEVILELDRPQPQVAIEVLLLAVSLNDRKQLGAQIRSREPGSEGLFGTNAKFQTSGLFGTSGIVENQTGPGVNRLLGNLLNLVSNGIAAGNTILSLGDQLSTWAIIQALQTASNVQVLANPFLVATNKTKAAVSLGEVRRLITSTIIGTQNENAFGDAPAKLEVVITPQINSDGMIVLDISVSLSQFVGEANPDAAVRTLREIKTKTIVTNKEVIALGGLIQNNIENNETKVPILGDIPIIGWLFKNRQKIDSKSNLLILISSRIIEPEAHDVVTAFTNDRITDYTDTINEMSYIDQKRDPINRWFFGNRNLNEKATDEFLFRQQREAIREAKLQKDIVVPIAQNRPAPQPPQTHKRKQPDAVMAHSTRRSKKSKGVSA